MVKVSEEEMQKNQAIIDDLKRKLVDATTEKECRAEKREELKTLLGDRYYEFFKHSKSLKI
jgi:hypothetical protein